MRRLAVCSVDPVSSTLGLDLAVESFGLGDLVAPPVPVSQAWSNDVFCAETATGAYAVKLYALGMSTSRRSQLTAGMDFERLILRAGSIPVPLPVASGGEWLIELDTPAGRRLARCHRWVAGEPAAHPLRADLIQAAGRYLGVLHAMHRPGGDTAQLSAFDTDRWAAAVQKAHRRRLGWADQLAALTPLVTGLAADLERLRQQRRPMRISHRDYDPKNVVVDTAGQLVITDWDYAGPVLADVELLVAATSFADTDTDVATFITAYRSAGGDATGADPLAMTAEAADLDWLLRNLEACTTGADSVDTREHYATAADLITTFPTNLAAMRAWPERFASLCR
jgi:serine/threonine protein kinase